MSAWLALKGLWALFADLFARAFGRAVADWLTARARDRDQRALGRAEAELEMSREANEAERRAGEELARHRTPRDAARRMRDGTF